MIRTLLGMLFGGLLIGCSMSASDGTPGDDSPGDAGTGCNVYLTFDPMMALAGPSNEVRAMAMVTGVTGTVTYEWQVSYLGNNVTYNYAQADHSAIAFPTPAGGVYDVMVGVSANTFCNTAQAPVNVGVENATTSQVRIRVFPPSSIQAPPNEKLVLIHGGTPSYSMGNVVVDSGVAIAGQVSGNRQAYLRFIPHGARDAYVETFSTLTGGFATRVLNQVHDVLVVPMVPGIAPQLIEDWVPGMMVLNLDADVPLSGDVRGPNGVGLANTKVHMTIDGVPSTLTTTAANGTFTLRARLVAGARVEFEVTPPASTGLPRLLASTLASSTFDVAQPIAIRYAPTLATRDIAGTDVRRQGSLQAGAKVAIVGSLAAIGTIRTGTLSEIVSATGEVRIATTANGSGALPSVLAPAAPLFAVVTLGTGDHAVANFDLTSGVPAVIDAPPLVPRTTQLRDPALAAAPGAQLDLAPIGALAMAGAGTIRVTAGSNGSVTATLVAGGHYELRASDPIGRGAPLVIDDVSSATMATSYDLLPALRLTGSLQLSGAGTPVGRAAVQIRCSQCTGVERMRPVAEGASSGGGAFDIAVFDPGTN